MNKEKIADWFSELQNTICQELETEDGTAKFIEDKWKRDGGGGGRTRVISNGAAFEKGGVAFSAVHGKTPAKILEALNLPPSDFFATGVSIVIHPLNPWVPIIHMNVRYFEMSEGSWWFGGGIDLTPHYIDPGQAQYFHKELKRICDKHDLEYYPKFKTWADNYFYLPHRNETRGIGGIFFDRLTGNKEALFSFVQDTGKLFVPVYTELVKRNKDRDFSEKEKGWQALRRGRYVEFNLVYDKGTKFGLDTQGRTESILMSLPPLAEWKYNYLPPEGTDEIKTLSFLRKNINWIDGDLK